MPKLRLAPTPSGLLHVGNGVNFVLTAAWAHVLEAELLLRVDDLDAARVRGEYLNDIEDALHWLFPKQATALLATAQYQSRRLPLYDQILDVLRTSQQVYACRCSRRQIREAQAAAGTPAADLNHYPGTCRTGGLSLDADNVTWRLLEGDFVVRQRNGKPSYQLASVVDDVTLGVTHILRGQDLASSTAMQQVLAKALAPHVPSFAAFAKTTIVHHPLLLDGQGQKLSKRDGAGSLQALAEQGWLPEDVRDAAARLMGCGLPASDADLVHALLHVP